MRLILILQFILAPALAWANQAELVRCAAELKAIHTDDLSSQIFHVNGVILGSRRMLEPKVRSQVLLFVSNERTSRAYLLGGASSRVRIEIPHPDPRRDNQIHFIHYSHSDIYGSRLGDAYVDVPPAGHRAPSDYVAIKPVNLPPALLHRYILQLIADEILRVSRLHLRGKLSRSDLLAGNLSLCRGLKTEDTKMANWLDSQIADLEIASTPVRPLRMPAAVLGQ